MFYTRKIRITPSIINFILQNKWPSDRKMNHSEIVSDIYNRCADEMTENELYYLISDHCGSLISFDLGYNELASKVSVERLHKSTHDKFSRVIKLLYNNNDINGKKNNLISEKLYDIVTKYGDIIDDKIHHERDNNFDYFGIRTLERSYLIKLDNNIVERPQYMIMRVALGIHGDDLDSAFETYDLISNKYFTHATPTLFNAGTPRPQLSSCFLMTMSDNIEHIFKTISDTAFISKWAGGIGINISDIRARNSLIRGTNGLSSGIIPLCVLINKLGKYINQGGKRNGSIALYLEPWHADIYNFCELRKNTGDEDLRARDLFLALWVPDLLMKRIKEDGMWSLMCPDKCPGLTDVYGKEFEELYIKYENEGRYIKQVKATELWYHILECQIETGIPYLLYKDHANKKSNQKNLGTIKCSNLCSEIIQYTSEEEIAVCNLASICLPSFIENKEVNYSRLENVTRVIVRNLNKIIDINFYPVKEAKDSNMRNRPIGIGIQGLADVFNILELPFGSEEALLIDRNIFETIYYAALDESCNLAEKYGKYDSFDNSPFSEGKLQWHLWGLDISQLSSKYDWNNLIERIKEHGTRNSLLTTIMPTSSTAQIMGNSEGIEPITSNIFTRSTLAGEYLVINHNLIRSLENRGLWNSNIRKKIVAFQGSIQNIHEIPSDLKQIYKTAFEIYQRDIINHSAIRGPFIDQSQSLNLFMEHPDFNKLSNCHHYSWEKGLKTAIYYLRSKPAVNPIQFGIDAKELDDIINSKPEICIRNIELPNCHVCSS